VTAAATAGGVTTVRLSFTLPAAETTVALAFR
jgi:hypothetical protein